MRAVALILFIIAVVLMQILIGGAGLVYAFPANLLLGLAGLALIFVRREKCCSSLALWSGVSALLLAGFVIARTYFSPVEYLARWDLFLALGALISYFMTGRYFNQSRARLMVVGVLATLSLVHVVIGAVQFKQDDNFMLIPWIIRSDWDWRASGFYIYPNHLAGLLEMLFFMALSIACWGRVQNGLRILAGYSGLMCVVGIALTGSRGGYLSTLFGLLVFCGFSLWVIRRIRPDRQWPMTFAALLGVALLVAGAMFFMTKSASITTRVDTVYDPTNMRLFMWQSALQQFQLNPVTGTGSGTFLYYAREFRHPEVQADPIFVHNDYLHLLAEYGVIGAALGAIFLGLHLFAGCAGLRKIVIGKLQPEWRTSSNELALLLGALCGVAALLVHSVVDFNFHLPANVLLGAMLFAILATPSADLQAVGEKPRRGGWLAWTVPAVSVAMLALAVPLLQGEYFCELARRALRDRRYEEARALAERAVGYERKNPNLYFYLAEARHFLTEEEKDPVARAALHELAAEGYEKALQLFPKDTRTLLKLGMTLDLAGRFADADAIYQRAIEGDRNFGNVYAYYGLHFKLQRRMEEAEGYFRKASELGETTISGPALSEIERFKKFEPVKRFYTPPSEEQPAPEVTPPRPTP